jgi:hypothetical protein
MEQNIKSHSECQHKDGLKNLLEAIYSIRFQIRKLDISGNKGINSPGALDVLKKYLSDQLTLIDLNISHLQFDKENLHKFTSFILE